VKPSDLRNRAIVAMAQTGMTYADIGATFGVTRERVRQILNKAGITGSTTRSARAATKQATLSVDRERILEWAKHNPGLGARDAEEALDLKEGRVSEALGSDVSRVFVRQKPNTHLRYTDEVIFESLRCASIVQGEPMSRAAYDEYVAVFGGPTGVLLTKRFGSWKGACRAAGLAVHSGRGNTNRRWSQGQLVEVLIDYFNSSAARGTLDDYCRWAGEEKAVRPSGPTILNRFGSWTAAKRAALAAGVAFAS
jgi:transposase